MKNVHRLLILILPVLTAGFVQEQSLISKDPQASVTTQDALDKSSPKLSPQQEQRVRQLRQQAQSLFRNLQQVLGELQRLPKRGTQGLDVGPVANPNPRGPQQRPGPQRGTQGLAESSTQNRGDGATSNPSGGVVDGDRIAQTGRNDAAYIKIDGLVKQAQQIVNNLEGIGNEAKALGFLTLDGKGNDLLIFNLLTAFAPQQLQQMGKELEKFGVIWTGKVE